ncbi:hypothetical protein CI102_6765 [Trichoderma harzianum]|nr:hypothetical protein CI102_6765 [Trichoderma harzianum]
MTRAANLPLIIPFPFFFSFSLCVALFSLLSPDWLVSATLTPVDTHHLSGDAKALTFEALHFGRSTGFLFLRSGFCASAVACRHAAFYANCTVRASVDNCPLGACKTASYCRGPYEYIPSQVDLIARTPGQTGRNNEKPQPTAQTK